MYWALKVLIWVLTVQTTFIVRRSNQHENQRAVPQAEQLNKKHWSTKQLVLTEGWKYRGYTRRCTEFKHSGTKFNWLRQRRMERITFEKSPALLMIPMGGGNHGLSWLRCNTWRQQLNEPRLLPKHFVNMQPKRSKVLHYAAANEPKTRKLLKRRVE